MKLLLCNLGSGVDTITRSLVASDRREHKHYTTSTLSIPSEGNCSMQLSFFIIAAAILRTIASGLIYTQSSIDDAVDHTPIVRDLNSNAILNSPPPAQGFEYDDQASAIDWATYTNKGGALTCGLLATDQSAGQLLRDARTPPSAASLWCGDLKQELSTWYWHVNGRPNYSCKLDDYWYIASAVRSLGLDGQPVEEGGDNACYRIEHWDQNREEGGMQAPAINQWYSVDGKEYRVSSLSFMG